MRIAYISIQMKHTNITAKRGTALTLSSCCRVGTTYIHAEATKFRIFDGLRSIKQEEE